MPFIEASFELGENAADAVQAVCIACGASAVTLVDGRDDPVLEPAPGEIRLWPATLVKALFPGDTDAAAVERGLRAGLGLPGGVAMQIRSIADKLWEREWLKDFHALRFGRRLWVCPHHEAVHEAGAVVVKLDPGLAFGTGTHPSTAACLSWLDQNLRTGSRVIDYGCGSGILAVAALKLGAAQAHCFDIDPQALIATRENAAANDVRDRLHLYESDDTLPDGVDLVLANILSEPLCRLAPRFAALLHAGGTVVLAGLMQHESVSVTEAYSAWFDMTSLGARDEWVGLSGQRRA